MHADLIIEPRWIIPIVPKGSVFENYAVVVRQGRIAALGPSNDIIQTWTTNERLSLPDSVLIPGLINLHSHAAMNLLRGLGPDLPLMDWLTKAIWPAENKLMSDDFVEDGSFLAGLEMAAAGVTTTNDMYFFPNAAARGLRRAGLRCAVSGFVIGFPSAWARTDDEYLRRARELFEAHKNDPFIRVTAAPHAPYTVTDELLGACATLSNEYDAPVHMHVHETTAEIESSLNDHGERPLSRLKRLGLVDERLIAVHAVHLNEDDIAMLADAGASVAHCPSSNLKLASGFAPVGKLLEAGINLGIGTDGAASNDKLDMLAETRLAALLAKAVAKDTTTAPVHEMLWAATMGGARALRWDKEIGSIECGKAADLTAVRLSGIECLPVREPATQLLYAAGRESVIHTWVAGNHIKLPSCEENLRSEAQHIAQRWHNALSFG